MILFLRGFPGCRCRIRQHVECQYEQEGSTRKPLDPSKLSGTGPWKRRESEYPTERARPGNEADDKRVLASKLHSLLNMRDLTALTLGH